MIITRLKANHLENPLGFDLSDLSLSWVAESTTAKKQKEARVRIAMDEAFVEEIYDSGFYNDANSLNFQPGITLKPRTRYYWQVEVTADNGETAQSAAAWFETGKMSEAYQAQWITPQLEKQVHPYMRKAFNIDGEIKSARVYGTAAGIFEMELNGHKISEEYLLPGSSSYDLWMQALTFDVTEYVKSGQNAIGAIIGQGWFSGRFALGELAEHYGDRMALLCEVVVTMADGSEVVIVSDESWKATAGPVSESGIYDGEYYDARKEIAGWSTVDCEDSAWTGVELIELNIGPIADRLSPQIIKHESFKPEVIRTPKGETVLDFGQNMAGWVEFDLDAPEGTEVFMQYGEILQDDCFYNENLRSAKAEFKYISNGKAAHVRPHFTFYGFRFVKVEGIEVKAEDFTAYAIHSQMEPTAEITTSDERINRLILNAKWGQKGNFVDVPTDCPQRDERMGWTGDAQIFAGTASFFTDTAAFYQKFMMDLHEEQKLFDGGVPYVIPCVKGCGMFSEGHSSCAWGDAASVIPWTVYLYFGDKSLLAKQYDAMKDWVDHIYSVDEKDGGHRLWQSGFHFADWLALDNLDKVDAVMGRTDPYYIASAYYYYSTRMVADAAGVLGKSEDVMYYRNLQNEIREAFRNEYFTPNGKIAIDTQTAHVVALFMDLIPDEQRPRVVNTLKTLLEAKGIHLDTGFVGTPYLCRALSDNGANDYAYRLLMNDDYPSWLYEVKMGATTVWERWNSVDETGHISSTGMNSLNHYAYGSVVEWICRNICGLNPVFGAPGFKKVNLKPQPYGYLKNAKMRYKSASGAYVTEWSLVESHKIRYHFEIPFDCTANVTLPDTLSSDVTFIRGQAPALSTEACNTTFSLEAGIYDIECTIQKNYIPTLSIKSTIGDILANDAGKAILEKHLGEFMKRMEFNFNENIAKDSLEKALGMAMGAITPEAIGLIDQELKTCPIV